MLVSRTKELEQDYVNSGGDGDGLLKRKKAVLTVGVGQRAGRGQKLRGLGCKSPDPGLAGAQLWATSSQ